VKAARATWFARVAAAAPERLIFLDETWFTTAMGRLYGYAPRGQRLVDTLPLGHWKRLTFVAGLTSDGMIAPRIFDGSMTGDRFEDYLRRALIPRSRPGDVLVMDNLPVHKTRSVRAVLKGSGIAVRYLPAYSPDRNPIEQAFSKLKRLARTAAERTGEGLKKLVRSLPRKLHPDECRNYVLHCGYQLLATKT
jgi:transposase